MNKEQIDVLNITQEVLRGVVASFMALQPEKTDALSTMLQASAEHPDLSPVAQTMLRDLAQCPAMFAAAGQRRQ